MCPFPITIPITQQAPPYINMSVCVCIYTLKHCTMSTSKELGMHTYIYGYKSILHTLIKISINQCIYVYVCVCVTISYDNNINHKYLHIYIYIYIYIYICVCVCVCVYTEKHTCKFIVYIYIYIYTYIYTCMSMFMHIFTSILNIMVIIIGNTVSTQSSNPGQSCLCFTLY